MKVYEVVRFDIFFAVVYCLCLLIINNIRSYFKPKNLNGKLNHISTLFCRKGLQSASKQNGNLILFLGLGVFFNTI